MGRETLSPTPTSGGVLPAGIFANSGTIRTEVLPFENSTPPEPSAPNGPKDTDQSPDALRNQPGRAEPAGSIRRHKIRHDRTREHCALANPGGRPRRINAA